MLAYDWNFLGLSTETKPAAGEKVVDGSTFYECDTSTFFIYYQGEWYQQTFVTEDGINFWLYKTLMKKMFGKWFDSNITLAKIIKPTTGSEIEFINSLPAQITDLTGYGNTFQQTYSGKNLLPNEIISQSFHGVRITKNADGSLILNGLVEAGASNYSLILGSFSAVSGVEYTISGVTGWNYDTLQLFGVSSVAFPVGNRIQCYNGPQTVTAQGDENVSVRLYIYAGQNYENVTIYPMIEQSDTATTYEPYVGGTASPNPDYPQDIQTVTGEQTVTINGEQIYTIDLGSIELCKIGNYQDYIYKSGDDWYVHKAIGEYTFKGTEDWRTGQYGTNPWVLRNVISVPYDTSKTQVISEVFRGIPNDDRSTSGDNVIYTSGDTQMYVRNTSLATLSDIRSATNGTDLYYALATPTDTKITDNTLIGNLNALLNYIFPAGDHQIVITADGLPMALKLTITEKE